MRMVEANGFIKDLDPGDVKPGAKTTMKVTLALNYIKHTIGQSVVLEIDALNLKFISNGVDISATERSMLGLG